MFKELVTVHVAPLMKQEGFKRNGTTWNKAGPAGISVLNLQNSNLRGDGSVDVTINMGILVKDVWRLCWGKDVPDLIKEENCYPRFRIGHLLEGFTSRPKDKWWKLLPSEPVVVTANEMIAVLREDCIPFFVQMGNMRDVASFVRNNIKDCLPLDRLQRALLLGLEGDEVSEIFVQLSKDPYWREFSNAARHRFENFNGIA